MANQKLSEADTEEIRESMAGLSKRISTVVAKDLAVRYGVSEKRIYAITADIRPKRKTRTDKGKHQHDLLSDPILARATELVFIEKVKPEHALEQIRQEGHKVPISANTFRRYLQEKGFIKKPVRQKAAPKTLSTKRVSITIPVDADIFDWFKAKGADYANAINKALRLYIKAHKRKFGE